MPVLVIEDSDYDFEILQACLRNSEVNGPIVRCRTGKEVDAYMSRAASLPLHERPAMIFLDLNLPGADGRAILPRLRNSKDLGAVPVIVLTTSNQPRDVELCYRAGASGYLVKPLDLDTFEQKIRQTCGYWLNCVQLPFGCTYSL